MMNSFTWEKGVFSSTYKIYSNGQNIGKLKDRTFSQSVDGEIHGKSYSFKTKGFLKQKTKIIDDKNSAVIGEITYNNWMTKAELSIHGKRRNWRYDNCWNTKWSIYQSDDVQIKYAGSSTKGQIDSNINDDLLLLSGLFVANYYWQIVMIICLISVIASTSTILV